MILLKIKTFLKSLLFHISLGLPKSSQKDIDARLLICFSCEKYQPEKKECGICGCFINNKRIFFNKLAWADQECPIGKWKKLI